MENTTPKLGIIEVILGWNRIRQRLKDAISMH